MDGRPWPGSKARGAGPSLPGGTRSARSTSGNAMASSPWPTAPRSNSTIGPSRGRGSQALPGQFGREHLQGGDAEGHRSTEPRLSARRWPWPGHPEGAPVPGTAQSRPEAQALPAARTDPPWSTRQERPRDRSPSKGGEGQDTGSDVVAVGIAEAEVEAQLDVPGDPFDQSPDGSMRLIAGPAGQPAVPGIDRRANGRQGRVGAAGRERWEDESDGRPISRT